MVVVVARGRKLASETVSGKTRGERAMQTVWSAGNETAAGGGRRGARRETTATASRRCSETARGSDCVRADGLLRAQVSRTRPAVRLFDAPVCCRSDCLSTPSVSSVSARPSVARRLCTYVLVFDCRSACLSVGRLARLPTVISVVAWVPARDPRLGLGRSRARSSRHLSPLRVATLVTTVPAWRANPLSRGSYTSYRLTVSALHEAVAFHGHQDNVGG